MSHDRLAGRRVLIVEDEAIIAMTLEDMVADLGCHVVGPVARVEHALARLAADPVDCAVLDVNLHGEPSYPVADALAARGVPFVFMTGYGAGGLKPEYRERPVVSKPVTAETLERMLVKLAG